MNSKWFWVAVLLCICIGMIGTVSAAPPIPMGKLTNNDTYLNISTYDGTGDQTHPSIIYTDVAWNGFHYLMAMTPYFWANTILENPSMRYSNDGYEWEMIAGQPDPIITTPVDGYLSDPNIALVDGTLYLFYRWTNGSANSWINRTTTTDGVSWTAEEKLTFPFKVHSPSFLYNGTGWECWAHRSNNLNLTHFTSASDNKTFSQTGTTTGIGMDLWHSEVKRYEGQYQLLAAFNGDPMTLYYFNSSDGLAWVPSASNPVMSGIIDNWDENLYKSSFIESNNTFRVWYAGLDLDGEYWHVGYTEYSGDKPDAGSSNQSGRSFDRVRALDPGIQVPLTHRFPLNVLVKNIQAMVLVAGFGILGIYIYFRERR